MLAEEAAAGAVGQGDALGGDLKGEKRGLTWHLYLQIVFMAKSLSSHAFPKMGEKERYQAPPRAYFPYHFMAFKRDIYAKDARIPPAENFVWRSRRKGCIMHDRGVLFHEL